MYKDPLKREITLPGVISVGHFIGKAYCNFERLNWTSFKKAIVWPPTPPPLTDEKATDSNFTIHLGESFF